MELNSSKELQAKKKTEVQSGAEQTRPGLVFTPAVDIFETEKELILLADMPRVKPNDISIDLKDNTLTIAGNVDSPKKRDEVDIFMEFRTGNYFRQFTLSEMIDQSKIEARMKDGVLKLVLPKVEKAAPRKIIVQTA
ncbi:MAG: heat-shock protein Hsp20 [Desulfobacca sp.]|nr:heat-shock protein Hsp20 [Desulfobacca sp.]